MAQANGLTDWRESCPSILLVVSESYGRLSLQPSPTEFALADMETSPRKTLYTNRMSCATQAARNRGYRTSHSNPNMERFRSNVLSWKGLVANFRDLINYGGW